MTKLIKWLAFTIAITLFAAVFPAAVSAQASDPTPDSPASPDSSQEPDPTPECIGDQTFDSAMNTCVDLAKKPDRTLSPVKSDGTLELIKFESKPTCF